MEASGTGHADPALGLFATDLCVCINLHMHVHLHLHLYLHFEPMRKCSDLCLSLSLSLSYNADPPTGAMLCPWDLEDSSASSPPAAKKPGPL